MTLSTVEPMAPQSAKSVGADALHQLFHGAYTCRDWLPQSVPEPLLRELYQLTALGPTAANCCPARVVFVCSAEAKERLLPLLDKGNRKATGAAPVTAIIASDARFYEQMPKLYPRWPNAASWLAEQPEHSTYMALQNSSLQGGYFIMAARALGLDCGPMGGFDGEAIAREFFPEKDYKVNFLCNLGYGRPDPEYARLPRLDFDEACQLV